LAADIWDARPEAEHLTQVAQLVEAGKRKTSEYPGQMSVKGA
jgi:hypothetical protein